MSEVKESVRDVRAEQAEREVRVALHLAAARYGHGGAAAEERIYEVAAERGVPEADARRALVQLSARGEAYVTAAGWRPHAWPPSRYVPA